MITSSNISAKIPGTVRKYYTEWDLPEKTKVELKDVKKIKLVGADAEQIAPLLSWSTSDKSIVKISTDGTITAKGYGIVNIAATDGNKSSTGKVVVAQNAKSVSFNDINMDIGERVMIKPQFVPTSATETDLVFTLDQNSVVEINEFGVIHALKAGSVTATGATDYEVKGSFTITVIDNTDYAVEGIVIVPDKVSLTIDERVLLKVAFTPKNVGNKGTIWFVGNVETVGLLETEDGMTAKGLCEGTTNITVISMDGAYSAECTIIVRQKALRT